MASAARKIPGISVEVEDLLKVQGHLSGLSLSSIRRRSSLRSGARETRVRGRGMEYEESRAYVAGDDMRTMDWRVMARSGEAHTKVFAEEKQRSFLLAIDLSASMFFGTRYGFKSWAAAYTAAHIGWLASLAGDRVGGLIVSPESHHEIRPGKNKSGLLGVFHHLAELSDTRLASSNTSTNSRLNFLLGELRRVVKPGSNIALMTDFLGIDEQTSELISGIVKHNDMTVFWIHDQTEVEHWPGGHYQVLLDGEKTAIEIPASESRSWLKDWQLRHRQEIETLTTAFNLPFIPISCNREISPQIVQNINLL